MTVIFNDPASFADDQLEGFAELYADRLRMVPGGVVGHREGPPRVAVVIGGGSGHYPAFAGLVGTGFAAGAVVGNVFTSPSAAQVYSVAKASDQGRGVILSFGNYAGDLMNFGIAADRLRSEGVDIRIVTVTDDIASSPTAAGRRGIAGDFTVFKVMGAAAEQGSSLDEVERLGRLANDRTRSFGVAFTGCTMPGATAPLFAVPDGAISLGLGIHGEPGVRDTPRLTSRELAAVLVDGVLSERPSAGSARVAVIVNGLGSTKHEELFILWRDVAELLRRHALTPVGAEVGELVTSLDMGGCSLTLMWLDDELEAAWQADAYAPAYRKVGAATAGLRPADIGAVADERGRVPESTAAARALVPALRAAAGLVSRVLHDNEAELGRIDAVAGDGDHGRGMVKGIDAAAAALTAVNGGGLAWNLHRAGREWAAQAGGTSGVLWGAGIEAAAALIGDDRETYDATIAPAAVDAFLAAVTELGGAHPNDKTMVDALTPFAATLRERVESGVRLERAWADAAAAAAAAGQATAAMRPRKGRARPLAERSLGTPDAGATSFALIAAALRPVFATEG
ncbi:MULTISPECIES: dihydroxyacetone kinase family protein [unclassified Microbacterium]|uniref:dihydroxyacetone kinase family protein n=1 Tax=unclassified Microbacterium TaxID=2609290 RepID=UPI00214B643D|nr:MULTISPECIES: dihydroxyacetone kinase family protein [unclassified Microbacterium]MCR2810919.1 dihydroxyacetone kinase family protein [Microbacterium sp. zg.B185]WIM19681.1 dihydroxyacetone kinase family protein [Microbacterium sp. zg-B185]